MERAIVRKKGWIILTSLVVIAVIAVIGGKMYMDTQEKKFEYQKQSAKALIHEYQNLEKITFDKDGGRFSGTENDFGKWYIGVKMKINNHLYTITTGKNGGLYGGVSEDFPFKQISGKTITPVKVEYSNGSVEVLK